MNQISAIKERIIEKYDEFTPGEKKVAKYIIDNFSQTVLFTCPEIASKSDVSIATVIRFTRSLGYDGFLDFKRHLKANSYDMLRNPYDYLKKMESNANRGPERLREICIDKK